MSKNTGASRFRKVNVDDFDEDKYVDLDEQTEEYESEGPNESEVNNLLSQKKNADALRHCLTHSAIGSKNQNLKDRTFQLILRVLMSFKASDIESVINTLDSKSIDILMKYIYRGFECPSENSCGILLTWHEKAFASGGLGSIIRVLADRKSV